MMNLIVAAVPTNMGIKRMAWLGVDDSRAHAVIIFYTYQFSVKSDCEV